MASSTTAEAIDAAPAVSREARRPWPMWSLPVALYLPFTALLFDRHPLHAAERFVSLPGSLLAGLVLDAKGSDWQIHLACTLGLLLVLGLCVWLLPRRRTWLVACAFVYSVFGALWWMALARMP